MHRITLVLVTGMLASVAAHAVGTLAIGETTVEGDRVIVPVILGGDVGSGVSALDFRLRYDPSQYQPVAAEAGQAALQADKRVMANLNSPGEYIVVMMGMNQKTCSSGEVARVVLERVPGEQAVEPDLGILRPTLSSVEGDIIQSQALPYAKTASRESNTDSGSPGRTNTDQQPQPVERAVQAVPNAQTSAGSPAAGYVPGNAEAVSPGLTPVAARRQAGPENAVKAGLSAVDALAEQAKAQVPGRVTPDSAPPETTVEHAGDKVAVAMAKPDPVDMRPLNAPDQGLVTSNNVSGALTVEEDASRTSEAPRRSPALVYAAIAGIGIAILTIAGSGWVVLRKKFS